MSAPESLNRKLLDAAARGRVDKAIALLERGADVDAKDDFHSTALMLTWEADIIIALLKHRADIEAQDNDGWTALLCAAMYVNLDPVIILVDHGANIEAKNNKGDTALMLASEQGHHLTVQFLLEHGADIGAQNNQGQTALSIAQLNNKGETMALLESYIEKQQLLESVSTEMTENLTADLLF